MGIAAGSVPRSTTQKLSERVSVLDFNAKGDGTTDDTAAINAGIAYCASKGKTLVFPAKLYRVSNLAPLTVNDTMLAGEPGARLKFTGTGVGITIDGSASGNGKRFIIRDLILDGNGTLDYCIVGQWMVGGELKNIRCTNCKIAGFRLRFGVLNLIDTLIVSSNVETFTTIPVSGIILDTDPTGAAICGGNTLFNLRIEGVSGVGIDLAAAQTTTIVGGTSEGNGTGIRIASISLMTAVIGIDCESNGLDLDIAGGVMNGFYNCICTSTNSVMLRSPAYQNHFYGGYYNNVTLIASARYNVFDNITLKGTIADDGYNNVFRNVINPYTGVYTRDQQYNDQTFNGKLAMGPAGTANVGFDAANIYFTGVGSVNRWAATLTGYETGVSNAGANLILNRYDDAGNVLGPAIQISRAYGGVTFYTPFACNAEIYITGACFISPGAGNDAYVYYTGATGVARWGIGKNLTDETGSNVGSDFQINRYSDTGAALGAGLRIRRSDGVAFFGSSLSVTGDCDITGAYKINGVPINTSGVPVWINGTQIATNPGINFVAGTGVTLTHPGGPAGTTTVQIAASGVNALVNNTSFGLATSINFSAGAGITLTGTGGSGSAFQVTLAVPSGLQLKRNVQPLLGGLPAIERLRPVTAEWNGLAGTSEGKRLTSVIAQELQAVIPDAVSPYRAKLRPEDNEEVELLGLEPMAIISHLILAVQQLARRVEELEIGRKIK